MTPRRVLLVALALCGAFVFPSAGCSGSKSHEPAADASAATQDAAPGSLAFMEECSSDEQCTTGLCYNFNAKGPHCSHACENDMDCEAPSPGCNGMGICKAP